MAAAETVKVHMRHSRVGKRVVTATVTGRERELEEEIKRVTVGVSLPSWWKLLWRCKNDSDSSTVCESKLNEA